MVQNIHGYPTGKLIEHQKIIEPKVYILKYIRTIRNRKLQVYLLFWSIIYTMYILHYQNLAIKILNAVEICFRSTIDIVFNFDFY